jgi:hypothetical protein
MNESPDPRRLAGALRFVAELSAVAAESAHSGAWNDDLAVRRRRRDEITTAVTPRRVARKAL